MAMQFNIGEAKDRLSQLVTAAERGEDVIIARSGRPKVRLVVIEDDTDAVQAAERARRASAFGMFRHTANWDAIEQAMAPMTEDELAEWYGKPDKFGHR
jgi:prevent-host-death family protein